MTTAESEVEVLRRQVAELTERMNAGTGGPDDSLTTALREMERGTFNRTPSLMDAPCANVDADGRVCGLSWKLNNDEIRPIHIVHPRSGVGHSYVPTPIVGSTVPKGREYQLTKADYAKYASFEPEPAPERPQDTYISKKDAAARLRLNVKAVTALVKAGTLVTDEIAGTALIRRESVDRVLAQAEAERNAGDPDLEEEED